MKSSRNMWIVGMVVFVLGGAIGWVIKDRIVYEKAKTPHWMAVVEGAQGQLIATDMAKREYALSFSKTLPHIVAFTDRPNRKVKSMPTETFFSEWKAMFSADPPNAVLMVPNPKGHMDMMVISITNPVYNPGTQSLTMHISVDPDGYTEGMEVFQSKSHTDFPMSFREATLWVDWWW